MATVTLAGRLRRVAYVSTQGGSVYALTLDDGSLLWKRTFGAADTVCGPLGISGTGAIDVRRGLLYLVGAHGRLHALDLARGVEPSGYPLPVAGEALEYVWGGLRIVGDTLYIPVASHCDETDAQGNSAEGRLVAIGLAEPGAVVSVFDPVPGAGNLGGIWGYGGVSVEPDGSFLYTGVGNSAGLDPACGCTRDDAGYGNHLVKLTPGLAVVDADEPPGVLAVGDQDFGAAPLLFQPHGCPPLAAANNKNGLLYIWDRTRLSAGPITAFWIGAGAAPFIGQPAWSAELNTLFDSEASIAEGGKQVGNGVAAILVSARGCRFSEVWRTKTGDGNQAPPLVVNDVVFAGGGTSGLYALSGKTGQVLWSYDTGNDTTLSPLIEAADTILAPVGSSLEAFAPAPLK